MKQAVIVGGRTLGRGSDELGEKLMASFLRTLLAAPDKPEALIFYNSGVLLLAQGSPVLDALEGLLQAGVDLVACGTCVGYYELAGKLALGRESNMQEIASLLLSAEKTVAV